MNIDSRFQSIVAAQRYPMLFATILVGCDREEAVEQKVTKRTENGRMRRKDEWLECYEV